MTSQSLNLLEMVEKCPSLLETFSVEELSLLFSSSQEWQNFIKEYYNNSWLLTAINPNAAIPYKTDNLIILREVERQHLANYLHKLNSLKLPTERLPWLTNYAPAFIKWMQQCSYLKHYPLINELLQLVRKSPQKITLTNKVFSSPWCSSFTLDSPWPENGGSTVPFYWLLIQYNQIDLLKKRRALEPQISIDLNITPCDDNHQDHGITLAWLLARVNRIDLLEEFRGQQPSLVIDLNAAPTNPEHSCYGITLAWWLVAYNQIDYLKYLRNLQPQSRVDLSGAPMQHNGQYYGIPVAWWLASHDIELLQELIAEQPHTIFDLNAFPPDPDSPDHGITLGWMLAGHNKIDLLQTLGSRHLETVLDLNAKPTQSRHLHHGITLAWWLAKHNRIELLKALINQQHEVVNLNAAPTHLDNEDHGITLAWWLVKHNQIELLQTLRAQQPQAAIDLRAAPTNSDNEDHGVTLEQMLGDRQLNPLPSFAQTTFSFFNSTTNHTDNNLANDKPESEDAEMSP